MPDPQTPLLLGLQGGWDQCGVIHHHRRERKQQRILAISNSQWQIRVAHHQSVPKNSVLNPPASPEKQKVESAIKRNHYTAVLTAHQSASDSPPVWLKLDFFKRPTDRTFKCTAK